MTKLEIAKEILGIYAKDPTQYATHPTSGACVYMAPNGHKCAVGQCLKNPESWADYNVEVIALLSWAVITDLDSHLQEKYRGHSADFWAALQISHDSRDVVHSEHYALRDFLSDEEFAELRSYLSNLSTQP